jgi:hypothetical protein
MLLVGAISLWGGPAWAQWTMDLAQSGEMQFQVTPGDEAGVTIINKLPRGIYRISAVVRTIQIGPLPDVAGLQLESAGCPDLVKVALGLEEATTETAVRAGMAQLTDGLATAKCTDAERTSIRAAMAATVYELPRRYVIRAGEELVVTVQRLKADGAVEKEWKLTLTTGAPGSWRTLYGLAILRDRDDKPFLTPGTKDGEFVVNPGLSKNAEGKPVKAAPSVFFTWMSRSAELGPLSVSPTLGIGATSEIPGLFGGLAFTYRQNLALVVGIPVVIQQRVKDKFLKDPIVKSALTTEDLTDRRYHLDKIFVGGVFRFASNPFAEAKKPAQEKPEEKAKPEPKPEGKPKAEEAPKKPAPGR